MATIIQCVGSACPTDLVPEVFSCVGNLIGTLEHIMAGADVNHLRTHCRKGYFDSTVGCIDVLYNRCTEEKDLKALKKLASPEYMRQSLRSFCSSIDRFVNSSSCIRSLDAEMQACMNKERDLVDNRLHNNNIVQDAIQVLCRYLEKYTACIEVPVRRRCDSRTADLVIVFADGLRPPMCERYNSSGNFLTCSLTVIAVLSVLVVRE